MRAPIRVLLALAAAVVGAACTVAVAGTITYYHNDLAGSPVVATNESGQVIWRESYRPYGERLTNAPASAENKIWFTSRRQDVETGLVYMGARFYDPVIGRFISTDPAGFDEGNLHSHNRYAYANNNPNKYIDRDGQQALLALTPPPAASANVPTTPLGKPSEAQQLRKLEGFSTPALGDIRIPSLELAETVVFVLVGGPAIVEVIGSLIFSSNDGNDKKSRYVPADVKRAADQAATDERGKLRCQYCGSELNPLSGSPNSREYDHINPVSKGGDSSTGNIVSSCRTCNRQKGPRTLEEWGGPR